MDIRAIICSSLQNHSQSLDSAIIESWSESGNSTDTAFSSWTATEGTEPWMVVHMTLTIPATTGQSYAIRQTVHFNYVSGFLLVNGKPAGRLPERIHESEEIKELFGITKHLRTYPSVLPGMSHQLASSHEGWKFTLV